MKAVRCPVCEGTSQHFVYTDDTDPNVGYYLPCHGCKDKDEISRGWVEVHEETIHEVDCGFTYIPGRPIYPGCVYRYPDTFTLTT